MNNAAETLPVGGAVPGKLVGVFPAVVMHMHGEESVSMLFKEIEPAVLQVLVPGVIAEADMLTRVFLKESCDDVIVAGKPAILQGNDYATFLSTVCQRGNTLFANLDDFVKCGIFQSGIGLQHMKDNTSAIKLGSCS